MKIIMKSSFRLFQIVLLMCGVLKGEMKTEIEVMEGDSVTLNLDPTQVQGFIQILWRFGKNSPLIAQIDGDEISYEEDERFRDRLQLNQTGSLTIRNIRTKHSGLYKAEIDHSNGQSYMHFIVTVYESPSVIDAAEAQIKTTLSVKEGDSVTLQTDIIQLHGDELIVWRFGDEGKLIAKHDIETKSSSLYDAEGRFRDRLELDHQTGSLTITNITNTDSGVYVVKISSSKHTLNKRFIVTLSGSGVSAGAVAGIVVAVVVLLLFAAVIGGVARHLNKQAESRAPVAPSSHH